MILVTMTGNKRKHEEFWFEDEVEADVFLGLMRLNYELDPNA